MKKTCTICGLHKHFSDFGKSSILKDGHRGQCKLCRKIEKAEYRLHNMEKIRLSQIKLREANPTKIKEYNEKYKARIDKYYAENSEAVKYRIAEYNKTEKGRAVRHLGSSNYRANKKSTSDNSITHTALARLKKLQEDRCYHCGTDLLYDVPFEVHLDHYVPLSKGGTHSMNNVVWSCKSCNLKKNATLPLEALNV